MDSSDNYSFDPVSDTEEYLRDLDDMDYYLFAQFDEDNPLPVILIEEDPSYQSIRRPFARNRSFIVIGDDPPSNPLFYGSCWVSGYDANLGDIVVYFPLSCKEDTWGVDANGYLFNISSGSVSGYLSGVYNNSVSASGFSYPRYRLSSGAGSSYVDLRLIPENSNMEIATAMEPAQNVSQLMPYVYVVLMGVIIVCFMKRF